MRGVINRKFFLGLMGGFVVGAAVLMLAAFFTQPSASALSIEEVGGTIGLGTADLKTTVINIIKWVLGILGLVAVIVIMYGGFVWMTAAGNADKVKKAKRIIIQGVIGLIIILLAWAIVSFVIKIITNATNGGGVSCTPNSVNGCYQCNSSGDAWVYHSEWPGCGLGGGDTFRVLWVNPADGETNVPLCSIVQANFNGNINAGSVSGNAHLTINGGLFDGDTCTENTDCASALCTTGVCQGDEVAGTWQVPVDSPTMLEFLPNADYEQTTLYRVELDGGPGGLTEAGASPRPFAGYTWSFTTSSSTLATPPTVTGIYPADNASDICLNTAIQATFSSPMRASSLNTSTVRFRDETAGADANLQTPFTYPNAQSFSTRPAVTMTAGSEYSLTLWAGNAGNDDPTNGIMDVCLNHLDGDANGTENDSPQDDYMPPANPASPWNFFADDDTTNTECTPEITGIMPDNGRYTDPAPGVQITGSNFGVTGNVFFNNQVIDIGRCFDNTNFPNDDCVDSWLRDSINTRVPGGPVNYGDTTPSNGARDGGVRVEIGSNPEDISNSWNFNVTSPQIQRLSGLNGQPHAHGGIGQYVTVIKRSDNDAGFGTTLGRVLFRSLTNGNEVAGEAPPCDSYWFNNYIVIKVPDLSSIATACTDSWMSCGSASQVGVQVEKSDGTRSNLGRFIYTNEQAGPGLCTIQPQTCGSGGDTRTLTGESFGTATGTVNFTHPANPPVNAAVTSWADQNIGITVPNVDNSNEAYDVNASNAVGTSNSVPFDVPCGGIPEVIEDTTCNLSQGRPSPSPKQNETEACQNALLTALFSTDMADQTLTDPANYEFRQCNTGGNYSDNNCTTDAAFDPPTVQSFTIDGTTHDQVNIAPPANLVPDTWYRMTISRAVTSANNVRMNDDYVWHFKTKPGAGNCPVDDVTLNPPSETQGYPASVDYFATASSACQPLVPDTLSWNWSSSNVSVADFDTTDPVAPYSATDNDATVITGSTPVEGTTTIRATTEGETGQGSLRIILNYCQRDSDCTRGGQCPNATCNVSEQRCNPEIHDIDPAAGPGGTTVTIDGCYLGNERGDVQFGTAGNGEFKCANAWNDNQIVVTAPSSIVGGTNYQVTAVTTNGSLPPSNALTFTGTDTCGGVSVPPSGLPGLCLNALNPPSGRPGEFTSVRQDGGYNLLNGSDTSNTFVRFTSNLDVPYSPTMGWAENQINSIQIPVGTQTGEVRVNVNNCPSNPVTFNVSCNNNSQCAAGECCLAGACVDEALCSSGGPGELCQIPDDLETILFNEANLNCPAGPVTPPSGYDCISNTGDRQSVPPPPPFWPDPSFGDDCRFCCVPGQIYNNLTCVADQGNCLSVAGYPNSRGLYCGCSDDSQCPTGQGCSPLGQRCCFVKPVVDSVDSNVCRNGAVRINFNTVMDNSTLNSDNIKLFFDNGTDDSNTCPNGQTPVISQVPPNMQSASKLGMLGEWIRGLIMNEAKADTIPGGDHQWCPVDISITNQVVDNSRTVTTVSPRTALPGDTTIKVVVKGSLSAGGGVYSNQRLAMSQGLSMDFDPVDTINDSYDFEYLTGPDICQLSRVEIYGQPAFSRPLSDLFTCAGIDTCTDDQSSAAGNQHIYTAYAYDQGNHEIFADEVNWSVTDPQSVIQTPLPNNTSFADITAQVNNGLANVKAEATAYGMTKSATVRVRVNLCENPWPDLYNGDTFPYADAATNYSTSYCRDPGDLPLLHPTSQVVIRDGSPDGNNGTNEMIKEFFFLRDGSNDAIGIRVMENEDGVSPSQWYREQFGPSAPEPQTLTVDGYAAVRAGRTVYVAATNIVVGNLYYNIYLISYNEGASGETTEIYNRLLANWEFNINIDLADREALLRDMRRLNDLNEIYTKLLAYKSANGRFPLLDGGTFIRGMSTSKWPSWQETLGAAIGGNLPVDPVNDFTPITSDGSGRCDPTNGYNDPNTCWNEQARRFQAPTGSHIYMYIPGANGDSANLFTKMEYFVPTFIPAYTGTPCDETNAICAGVFNYQFDVTGTAQDHEAPTLGSVTPSGTLNGTPTIVLNDVRDLPDPGASGVNRAEFWVGGTRRYTDNDSSNGWTWIWDTRQYPDGEVTLDIWLYDNAGNRRNYSYDYTIDNTGGVDSIPPFVQVTAPARDARVSGTVAITAIASDNDALNLFEIGVEDTSGGTLATFNCGSSPCTVSWNSTTQPNGNYIFYAFAMDNSGNDALHTIPVRVDNTDNNPPTVGPITLTGSGACADADNSSCNNPGGECSAGVTCRPTGTVSVSVTATDGETSVTRVLFLVDDVVRFTDTNGADGWTWSNWNTAQYTNETHHLTVFAYDQYDNDASASLDIATFNPSSDRIAPIVNFITPPTPDDGETVIAAFTVSVNSSDNLGVERVNFYFDYIYRQSILQPTNPSNFEVTRDFLNTLPDGCHTFSVRAYDSAGNVSLEQTRQIGVDQNCLGGQGQGPRITNANITPRSSDGAEITITARVVDTDGVNSVVASIQNPDETEVANGSVTLTCIDCDDNQDPTHRIGNYSGTWNPDDPPPEITYYVDLVATDRLGQRTELENI